jgi:hypothetical protein
MINSLIAAPEGSATLTSKTVAGHNPDQASLNLHLQNPFS